jgi:hypothetical protein
VGERGPAGVGYGRAALGGDVARRRARYQQLEDAALRETKPERKAQLLAERDAEAEQFMQSQLAADAMPAPMPSMFEDPPPPPPGAPVAAPPGADAPPAELAPLDQGPGPSSGLPIPSAQEWMSWHGGSGGNPAAVRRHSAAAQDAQVDAGRAVDTQANAVQQQGAIAQQAGRELGNVLANGAEQFRRMEQEHQERAEQQRQDRDQALQHMQAAEADLEREVAAQGKSVEDTWSSGRKAMAVVAMALGGMSAMLLGGRNHAADTIRASVESEVQQRRDRLAARKAAVGVADQHFQRLSEALGSDDAAAEAQKAAYYKRLGLKTEELAARAGGDEAAAKANELTGVLRQQEAEARAKAEAAAAKAAQGRRGASKADAYAKYVDLLGKVQKLNQDANKGSEDYLDGNARKRINQIDAGEEALLQLRRTAEEFKLQGRKFVPGQEPVLSEPGTVAKRLVGRATGWGEGGTTGMDPAEQQFATDIEMTGIAAYVAETENTANLQGEQLRSIAAIQNNGTLDGLIKSIDMKLEKTRAQRIAVTRKNAPELRQQQIDRHGVNPPLMNQQPAPPAGAKPRGQ